MFLGFWKAAKTEQHIQSSERYREREREDKSQKGMQMGERETLDREREQKGMGERDRERGGRWVLQCIYVNRNTCLSCNNDS